MGWKGQESTSAPISPLVCLRTLSTMAEISHELALCATSASPSIITIIPFVTFAESGINAMSLCVFFHGTSRRWQEKKTRSRRRTLRDAKDMYAFTQ